MLDAVERWERLDPASESSVDWVRPVTGKRIVVLLGAFDPPTNAHIAIARAASRTEETAAALGMTKVLLDRPDESLLAIPQRVALVANIAEQEGFGFLLANRGTYLEVSHALVADGMDPTFVLGADKLEQLADPKFYTDGDEGVAATFAELRLLVVPRSGKAIDRDDVRILDPAEAFAGARSGEVSGTEVRHRLRVGEPIDALVPAAVALALRGYTAAR